MITQEFREWVENIKESLKSCLGNLADVILKEYIVDKYPLVIHVNIKSNELKSHMGFDQSEYDNNNEEQRHKLAKSRCRDMAWSIGCEIEELKKVMEILEKND